MVASGDQAVSRFDDLFDVGLQDTEFYPGSRERRPASGAYGIPQAEVSPFDGVTPRIYDVNGQTVEFFTIGQLAAALNRKPVTLRKWEAQGILPAATFQAPNPGKDPRARRRLYTRAQAEGIVRIAREEGLLGDEPKRVGSTRFTERVRVHFDVLRNSQ